MSHFISTKVFVKISELDESIEFDSLDEFVVVDDSVTKKITGQHLTDSIVNIGNLASKSYVDAVVDGAPELLDTLNELAAALNDDANFATTITALIGTKLSTVNFGLEFWSALEGVTTFHIAEDTNLYFTEQRVLDVMASQPADRLISSGFEAVLDGDILTVPGSVIFTGGSIGAYDGEGNNGLTLQGNVDTGVYVRTYTIDLSGGEPAYAEKVWGFSVDGTLTLPAGPTSDNHAATKGYVDNQVDTVVAGQGFATLGYVEDAIALALSTASITGDSVDFGGGDSDLGNGSGGSSGGANSSGAISVVKVEKVNDEYVFTTLSGDVSGEYDAELNTAFFTLNGFTSLPSNVFAIDYYEIDGTMYDSMRDLFNSSYGINLVGSDDINPLTNFDPGIHKLRIYQFSQLGTTFYSFQSNGGSSGGVTSYNDLTDKPTLFQIGIKEPISAQSGASGVVDHNMATANIFNHSNLAGNFTCNVTNLSLPTNNAINVTLIVNQGATPYMPTAFQIGGVAQTINWLNGIAPAGSASKIDVASFSILNNSGTYTVLGSLSTFG